MRADRKSPFGRIIDGRQSGKTEKNLSTATLVLLDIVILTRTCFQIKGNWFYFQVIFTGLYIFLTYSYLKTLLTKNPSTRLPTIIFILIFLNTINISSKISTENALILIIISTAGIIVSSIKLYKKYKYIKHKKLVRRQDEIDKQLDDSWTESPHIIYDN